MNIKIAAFTLSEKSSNTHWFRWFKALLDVFLSSDYHESSFLFFVSILCGNLIRLFLLIMHCIGREASMSPKQVSCLTKEE